MNKNDFQVVQKSQKIAFERGVQINDKASTLRIEATLNPIKGIFAITQKIGYEQITGDTKLDDAMLKTSNELKKEAILYCKNWQKEWYKQQESDETDMFPDD